jgi:hypothetical protein
VSLFLEATTKKNGQSLIVFNALELFFENKVVGGEIFKEGLSFLSAMKAKHLGEAKQGAKERQAQAKKVISGW